MPSTCCSDYSDQGKKYDSIVLDPPAFAKSKQTLDTALRGIQGTESSGAEDAASWAESLSLAPAPTTLARLTSWK